MSTTTCKPWIACAAALLVGAAAAQVPYYPYGSPGGPGAPTYPGLPAVIGVDQGSWLRSFLDSGGSQPFAGQLPPGFLVGAGVDPLAGFPMFPPGALPQPDYAGGMLGPGQSLPMPYSGDAAIPPPPGAAVAPPADAWPSWLGEDDRDETSFLPSRAIVVRDGDRVWVREADEPAFVPLAFHSKFEVVGEGAEVEVRNKGAFHVVLHGGNGLRFAGPTRLAVATLTEQVTAFRLGALTVCWGTAGVRPLRIELPDGTWLAGRDTEFVATRSGPFVEVVHHGPGELRAISALGEVQIAAGWAVSVAGAPGAAAPLGAPLRVEGRLDPRRDGRTMTIEGGARGGAVIWNGARLPIPAGAVVRIDALGGDAFPDLRPSSR